MKDIQNVYDKLKTITYGWMDKNGTFHEKLDSKLIRESYMLQNPGELIKNKIGLCLDQVEYERENLNNFKSYFIVHNDGIKYYCHTFGVIELDKFYWIENAWSDYQGIHEYEFLDEIFESIIHMFPSINKLENVNLKDLYIYEYEKPKEHSSYDDFFHHCLNGKLVYRGK